MMGAQRLEALWGDYERLKKHHKLFGYGVWKWGNDSPDEESEEEGDGHRHRGPLTRTGQVLKESLGAVRRRTGFESPSASESEAATGSARQSLRRQQQNVPTLIEP